MQSWLLGSYCVPLVVSNVLNFSFFMFLQVLGCCLHIQGSHLFQSYWLAFEREIPFFHPVWGTESFSELFYVNSCSTHLGHSWRGEFLRVYAFSQSCQPSQVFVISFWLFLGCCWFLKFVCFLPVLQSWACLPCPKACSLCPGDMHRQTTIGWGN